MSNLGSDLRYALRTLIRRPGFTVIAVMTLALGIGANTVIFSAVNALLLKPLSFPELDRVVAIWHQWPSRGVLHNEVTMADYLDWTQQNKTFANIGLYRWWSANLTGVDSPERVQGFLLSANFFDTVGVRPFMGRNFSGDENTPGKDSVAILTYSLWQRRFGGDPNIINKTVTINGASRTVIGVMPAGFNYPKAADIYAPIAITPALAKSRDNHSYLIVGRLKTGVTLQSAQADIDTITTRLEQQYPETNTGLKATVLPIVADTVSLYNTALWVLMGAVGFVLLIACANVANLMLARATGRQKEIALRAALGASRWRIIRQLLTESIIVALIGGALGVFLAFWGIDLLRVTNPGELAKYAPGWNQLGINLTVLFFAVCVSVLSGLIFGLAPSLQVSRPNLNESLKETSRLTSGHSNRMRSLLVVFEVAMSLVLLIGSGLLVRSFLSLLKTNAGFSADNVMTMSTVLPAAKYKDNAQRAMFFSSVVEKVKALPGVESAAAVNYLPLGGSNSSDAFLIEGLPEPAPGQEFDGRYRVCTPDYFKTMGISVLKGRAFTDADTATTQPVIIVNETLAKKYWPNQEAIGKRMRFYGPIERAPWMEVVGVVQDVKHELETPVTPDYYLPHAQDPWNGMVLVAKTTTEPVAMAAPMREVVWSIDKDQPVFDVKSMPEVRATSIALFSFSSVTFGIFAIIAVALAAIGIYGVMAFAVSQRTHEIGIRMALGASSGDVLRMIVKNGMGLAACGVVIGLGAAWGLTRFMEKMLFGIQPTDLLTFSLVTFALLAVAFLACYIPARRATKVDPLVALHYE